MKAIILAAGQGKRLYPLTKNQPKCLVKLFGKSIIEWQIEKFDKCNIKNISIVRGYLGDMINFSNINTYENKNYDSTNMVETLFCAKEELTEDVIISYGDIIFEENVIKKLIQCQDDFAVIIDKNWEKYWKMRFQNPLSDAESLKIDNEGFIMNIGQRVNNSKEIEGQYIGLMKIRKNVIKNLKEFYEDKKMESKTGINPLNKEISFEQSFMTDLIQSLINSNYKIKAVPIFGGWLELDTIDDYELYEHMQNENTIEQLISINK